MIRKNYKVKNTDSQRYNLFIMRARKKRDYNPLIINNLISFVVILYIISPSLSNLNQKHHENIKVKSGDWLTYDSWTYQFSAFPPPDDPIVNNVQYTTIIKILNVSGDMITFKESWNYSNYSDGGSRIVSADLTIVNEHPYSSQIHMYLIPANLRPGDRVPTLPKGYDVTVKETVSRIVTSVRRELNRVVVNEPGNASVREGTWDLNERDSYFDKSTGVMVEWYSNRIDVGYYPNGNVRYFNIFIRKHVLKSTNIWTTPLWIRIEFWFALLVFVLLIYILRRGQIFLRLSRFRKMW